jgi:hypothetical protein
VRKRFSQVHGFAHGWLLDRGTPCAVRKASRSTVGMHHHQMQRSPVAMR